MRIFDVVLLIGIIFIIIMGAVFAQGMFTNLNQEGTDITDESNPITTYGITYSWIYIIAALLIIAVVIVALKMIQASTTS